MDLQWEGNANYKHLERVLRKITEHVVVENQSRTCPAAGSGISGNELSCLATRVSCHLLRSSVTL